MLKMDEGLQEPNQAYQIWWLSTALYHKLGPKLKTDGTSKNHMTMGISSFGLRIDEVENFELFLRDHTNEVIPVDGSMW